MTGQVQHWTSSPTQRRPRRAPGAIAEQREEYALDLLLTLDENIRPRLITMNGARSILQRLSDTAEIAIDHPKHDYLTPHGGRRGMGEVH